MIFQDHICLKPPLYGILPDMAVKRAESLRELPSSFAMHTISLATSGFSLVAALAWNELIKTSIEQYIRPYLGKGSDVISLIIYAAITTVIAVLVTMQLGKINDRLAPQEKKV